MDRLATTPHVVAAAPAIYEQVLISRGPRARGAVLKGIIPAYQRKVSDLLSSVTIGSDKELQDQDQAQIAPSEAPHAGTRPPLAAPSADGMESVEQRVLAMPPIIL